MAKTNFGYFMELASEFERPVVNKIDGIFRISIPNLDRCKEQSILVDLEGKGNSLSDAAKNYFDNAMDKHYTLRYKHRVATFRVRNFIESIMNEGE